MKRKATDHEQDYLDKAAYSYDRALKCGELGLGLESLTNLGSTFESLLKVGSPKSRRLNDLLKKFERNPLLESAEIIDHLGAACVTCYGERVGMLRNSVHPDRLAEIKPDDLRDTDLLIHVMITNLHRLSNREVQNVSGDRHWG